MLALALGCLPLAAAELACAVLGWGGGATERYFAFLPDFYLRSGGLEEFAAKRIPPRGDEESTRILCVGGSTTAGYPYEGKRSFPRELQAALAHVAPETTWEVINAGHNGWCSAHVRGFLDPAGGDALARSGADLVVVCSGHNEFLDRLQHRVPWSGGGPRSWLWRLAMHSRLFGRIRFGLRGGPRDFLDSRRLSREHGPADLTLLDRLHLDRPLQENLPMEAWERELHLRRYRENLTAIVDLCAARGVPVVLCTLASGTRDVEPMRSEPSRPLGEGARKELRRLLDDAWAALRRAEAPGNAADRAIAIDAGFAEAHFLRGRALLALGRGMDAEESEAERALLAAKDLDAAPMRAPSAILAVTRDVARSRGVPLFDVEALFRAHAARAGSPGREWIVDTLHPNARGYRLFGLSLAAFLLREGLVPAPAGSGAAGPASPAAAEPSWLPEALAWIESRIAALDQDPSPIPEGEGDREELLEAHDQALVSDAAFALLFGNPGACERMLEGIPEKGSLRRRTYRRALLLQAIVAKGRGDLEFLQEARERLLRADPRVRSRARQETTRKILEIPGRKAGRRGKGRGKGKTKGKGKK